jgi:hypothetical protein
VNQGVKNFTEMKFQDPNPDIAPQRDKYLVYHDFADIFIREKESADKRVRDIPLPCQCPTQRA